MSLLVGRTGFEPVTSSVSGKSRTAPGVYHRRTESNEEPLSSKEILPGSCYVRGWLNTLAPISGSRSVFGAPGAVQATPSSFVCHLPVRGCDCSSLTFPARRRETREAPRKIQKKTQNSARRHRAKATR